MRKNYNYRKKNIKKTTIASFTLKNKINREGLNHRCRNFCANKKKLRANLGHIKALQCKAQNLQKKTKTKTKT